MNVDVVFLEKFFRNLILLCHGTNKADARLRRLLHHIAELAGQQKLSFSRHHIDLDLQRIAADCRPGKTAHNTNLRFFVGRLELIPLFSEELFQVFFRHNNLFYLFLENLSRALSADSADLALQGADTGLSGVAADHFHQRLILDHKLCFFQTVRLLLLRNEMFFCDMELLVFRIA